VTTDIIRLQGTARKKAFLAHKQEMKAYLKAIKATGARTTEGVITSGKTIRAFDERD